MQPRFRGLITSEWLAIRVQLALGAIFIAASLPKITDPPSFAHMLYNYRLLPGMLINPMALVMPWLELLSGIALVLGMWRVTARTIIGLLLLVFIAAVSINLLRSNAIDCGCFDVSAAGKTYTERLADMHWVIVRDVAMLLMVAQLFWSDATRRSGPTTLTPGA